METRKSTNKKRVVASVLGLLMVMQQSAVYASTITNAAGENIPTGANGQYWLTPDMVNEALKTGFRKFKDFNLSAEDVANFLFTARNSKAWVDGNNSTHEYSEAGIDTFVAAVQNQVNINGIVNALSDVGGTVGGHLILVSPNGVVVGQSGVLNVGSLSVITPQDNDAYKNFTDSIQTAKTTDGENFYYVPGSTVTWDPSALTVNGAQAVDVQGRIAATNNINIQTGTFNAGQNALMIAGAGNNTITTNNLQYGVANVAEADTLFNALVNNGYSNAQSGNINVSTATGVNTAAGSQILNLGNGNTTITNTGADGVLVAGTLTNSNGNLTINNTGANGIGISGAVTNSNGILEAINSGKSGINISGTVENTGTTNITNQAGGTDGIKLTSTGRINNHGSSLNITNDATGGIDLRGVITGDNKALVNVTSNNSNVTIGDVANEHNIIADNTVTVNVTMVIS